MKYQIGNIVKMNNGKENYIILCTKNQVLDVNYLKQLKNKLQIKNIEKMAENILFPQKGFDYVVSEIKTIIQEDYVVGEQFINVFEEDLVQ